MDELSHRLRELEDVLKSEDILEEKYSPGDLEASLITGYNNYLVNSRERGENINGYDILDKDDTLDIINDNVQLSAYNFEILKFILISLKNANAKISTLDIELRLLKLNLKGGKGKTKKTKKNKKRVVSNNLTK